MVQNLTAHETIDLIKSKKVSCKEVTEAVLNRINSVEDKVKAYITLDSENALKRAEKFDEKISKGEDVGPLYGLPLAIKDNICTKDIKTTCASKILYNFVPPYDATVIKKLKDAGMNIIGKLNMDEFAMGSSTENSAFHTTRNPWNIETVPGGSSGGSAACVAADEAYFTLGSDTGGSIRQPASLCGVVGMKPTYGRVSRFGLIAFASSLDQIGPLTKDVTDCALSMNIICGHDPYDATSAPIATPDFTKALVNDVKGIKIGVPKEYMEKGINDEVRKSVEKALELLESLGATWEEFSIPIVEYALPTYYIIASSEASSNLARYDGVKYGYRTESYDDLLDLYKKTRSEGFGAEVKRRIMLGTYALSAGYYDAYYKKGLKVRTLIKNAFDEAFSKYDVIISPTSPTTAFKIGEKVSNPIEMYMSDICTVPVNIAGLPAISIPSGLDSKGLPIGLQIIGKAFDEETILRVAYTFEQNSNIRNIKPKI
ncbi:Asp-tRNA(Asn)/Glu-tRNA(Gln) amidotransferase subunit GatA [Caldicellulosiruptoraceae bacterium PP1]